MINLSGNNLLNMLAGMTENLKRTSMKDGGVASDFAALLGENISVDDTGAIDAKELNSLVAQILNNEESGAEKISTGILRNYLKSLLSDDTPIIENENKKNVFICKFKCDDVEITQKISSLEDVKKFVAGMIKEVPVNQDIDLSLKNNQTNTDLQKSLINASNGDDNKILKNLNSLLDIWSEAENLDNNIAIKLANSEEKIEVEIIDLSVKTPKESVPANENVKASTESTVKYTNTKQAVLEQSHKIFSTTPKTESNPLSSVKNSIASQNAVKNTYGVLKESRSEIIEAEQGLKEVFVKKTNTNEIGIEEKQLSKPISEKSDNTDITEKIVSGVKSKEAEKVELTAENKNLETNPIEVNSVIVSQSANTEIESEDFVVDDKSGSKTHSKANRVIVKQDIANEIATPKVSKQANTTIITNEKTVTSEYTQNNEQSGIESKTNSDTIKDKSVTDKPEANATTNSGNTKEIIAQTEIKTEKQDRSVEAKTEIKTATQNSTTATTIPENIKEQVKNTSNENKEGVFVLREQTVKSSSPETFDQKTVIKSATNEQKPVTKSVDVQQKTEIEKQDIVAESVNTKENITVKGEPVKEVVSNNNVKTTPLVSNQIPSKNDENITSVKESDQTQQEVQNNTNDIKITQSVKHTVADDGIVGTKQKINTPKTNSVEIETSNKQSVKTPAQNEVSVVNSNEEVKLTTGKSNNEPNSKKTPEIDNSNAKTEIVNKASASKQESVSIQQEPKFTTNESVKVENTSYGATIKETGKNDNIGRPELNQTQIKVSPKEQVKVDTIPQQKTVPKEVAEVVKTDISNETKKVLPKEDNVAARKLFTPKTIDDFKSSIIKNTAAENYPIKDLGFTRGKNTFRTNAKISLDFIKPEVQTIKVNGNKSKLNTKIALATTNAENNNTRKESFDIKISFNKGSEDVKVESENKITIKNSGKKVKVSPETLKSIAKQQTSKMEADIPEVRKSANTIKDSISKLNEISNNFNSEPIKRKFNEKLVPKLEDMLRNKPLDKKENISIDKETVKSELNKSENPELRKVAKTLEKTEKPVKIIFEPKETTGISDSVKNKFVSDNKLNRVENKVNVGNENSYSKVELKETGKEIEVRIQDDKIAKEVVNKIPDLKTKVKAHDQLKSGKEVVVEVKIESVESSTVVDKQPIHEVVKPSSQPHKTVQSSNEATVLEKSSGDEENKVQGKNENNNDRSLNSNQNSSATIESKNHTHSVSALEEEVRKESNNTSDKTAEQTVRDVSDIKNDTKIPEKVNIESNPQFKTHRFTDKIKIIKEISQYIESKSKDELVIQITPENLGKVRIALKTGPDQLQARIEVESDQVKNMIETNLDNLKQNLQNQGQTPTNIQVALAESQNKQNNRLAQERKKNEAKAGTDIDNIKDEDSENKKTLGYNTYEFTV